MNGLVLALATFSASVSGQSVGHMRFKECLTDADCAVIPGDTCVASPGNTGLRICMNTVTEAFCGTQGAFLTSADIDTQLTLNEAAGCAWQPFKQFEFGSADFSSNLRVPIGQGAVNLARQDLRSTALGTAAVPLTEAEARQLYPCNVYPKALYKCCNACTTGDRLNVDGGVVDQAQTAFACNSFDGNMWTDGSTTNRYVPTYFSGEEPRCPCQAPAIATSDSNPVLAGAFNDCQSQVTTTQNGQQVSVPEQCCTMRKYPEWVAEAPVGTGSERFPRATRRDFPVGEGPGALNAGVLPGQVPQWWTVNGWCFNPLTEACCDDGTIFNPGQFKCCAVEGVTDISAPCMCSSDAQCKDPSKPESEQRDMSCCMAERSANPSVALGAASAHAECDRYHRFHNFAAFTLTEQTFGRNVPSRNMNCNGICVDKAYQICCNGNVCQSSSETCCDSVCCNKFSQKCAEGAKQDDLGWLQLLHARNNPHADSGNILDSGARTTFSFGNGFNIFSPVNRQLGGDNTRISQLPIRAFFADALQDNHVLRTTSRFFGVNTRLEATYQPTAHNLGGEKLYCTRIEEQNAYTMYFAYVWPTTLLLAFTVAAGVVLSHLTNWATRPLSLIEKLVLVSAVVSGLFSLPTWFNGNNYVFGIVIAWTAFFTLIAVGSGLRKPVVFAALANLFVFLYIVNPFNGGALFNASAGQDTNAITSIFRNHILANINPADRFATNSLAASTASYQASTHRIVNFATGDGQTNPADRVVAVYSTYFQLDPRLLDFRSWNPYELYFGYATRGWTIAVGVFMLISFIALFVQLVLLILAYFLHAHQDSQAAQIESDLVPAFEEDAAAYEDAVAYDRAAADAAAQMDAPPANIDPS